MKKDIPFDKVKEVAIAIVPSHNTDEEWSVYLINLQPKKLSNLLVTSKGYGVLDDREVETSTLRKLFEQIDGKSANKIEPIHKELFGLTNEFWISYWVDGQVYDKKYVFVQESIVEENLTHIPILNTKGVMIK